MISFQGNLTNSGAGFLYFVKILNKDICGVSKTKCHFANSVGGENWYFQFKI